MIRSSITNLILTAIYAGLILPVAQAGDPVFVKQDVLQDGSIRLSACERNVNNVDSCVMAGRESGYTKEQLQKRVAELNAKAKKEKRIIVGSTLIGAAIGAFALGLPAGGDAYIRWNSVAASIRYASFPAAMGAGVGGIAGNTIGEAATANKSSKIASAQKSITTVSSSLPVTRAELLDSLNYALMGIPDGAGDSLPKVADQQRQKSTGPITVSTPQSGRSGAAISGSTEGP